MTLIKSFVRKIARRAIVNSIGSVSKVAPGVHILAGHYTSRNLNVNDECFERLLSGLSKKARFIRIEDACEIIDRKECVDEPLIAFTFDDGFQDCFVSIAPALERYKTNAAFFINPGFAKSDDMAAHLFSKEVLGVPGKKPMRESAIRSLAESGFVIGAHTIDHADLRSQDNNFLTQQIVGCKSLVEEISGTPCNWFAWTYGGYKHISEAALSMALETYDRVFSSDSHESYTGPDSRILNRRHFEPFWSLSEVKFFTRKKRFFPSQVPCA